MASSSVSQESLDMEDFEMTRQRNRIRTHRGRGMLHRAGERDAGEGDGRDQNGDGGDGPSGFQDHDSPTRTAARAKDKRTRPNHLHKGKLPKDKRKLREKRRSTGVVHLQSTESTGDSLDDDDEEDKNLLETKKNTVFNEITEKNKTNHEPHSHHHSSYPHHSHHTHHTHSGYTARRNKSPSDLEADLEDNQDYDSTVSHSETNLTLIGRSESSDTQISLSHLGRPAGISKFTRYSPETPASFTHSNVPNSSDQDSTKTNSTSSAYSPSPSVLSRYPDRSRDADSVVKDSDKANVGKLRDSRTESTFSSYPNRFRSREEQPCSPIQSHVQARISGYPGSKPFVPPQNEYTSNMEKQLEKEKDENKRLKQILEEKDRRIAELEREVSLLNKEMDDIEDQNIQLEEEKSTLIRSLSQLSTNV